MVGVEQLEGRSADASGWEPHQCETPDDREDRRQSEGGPARLVAEGPTFPGGALGFRAGAMVRDPDGHALRVLAH